MMEQSDIRDQYREKRSEIETRLQEFRDLRNASEERKFLELVFVILTSRTKAKKAWAAAEQLERGDLLRSGDGEQIQKVLETHEVQYAGEKADYIVESYGNLSQPTLTDPERKLKISDRIDPDNPGSSREWFVENVKGIGWKGASHFLRNIGYGDGFAIISSHILNMMNGLGLLDSPDPPGGKEEYLEMEEKLRDLGDELGIDVQALDLVLWSMRTGEVFK